MKRLFVFSFLIIAVMTAVGQFNIYPSVKDSTSNFRCQYPAGSIVVNKQDGRCYLLLGNVTAADNLQNSMKKQVPCYNPYDRKPEIITQPDQPVISNNSYGFWRKLPEGKLYLIINRNGNQFIYEQ